ncbi:sugar-binding transcriptional regulator [Hydromonas duriensis]|uniref:DNA-binding transcriptional regulator LsrR (DeoR family) n=1 Tax=Hydromonas duriensis TaxID=1527608 RepID=A0A4V3DJL8_9BURK|nr:sugar-binding transcriptional regulator [Hydromonas duriensis]TDR30397.1 DNA-binding transcriptional regulator LsrR (DeoR family) [Hydromonas duriensis]
MDEKLELQAKVAWLYYIGNVTQQDIAKQLSLSRPTIQRLLNLAIENGVVQVKIDHTISTTMDLAERLKKRFNLIECEVAPIEESTATQVDKAITVTAGRFLEQVLRRPKITGVALGTGRAVRSMCHGVSRHMLNDFKVVSLAGTVVLDGSFNRYDASLSLADKTDGKYYILSIPLFAENLEDRDYWYSTRTYKRQLDCYTDCQVAMIGVGWMGERCPLVEDGFITTEVMYDLVNKGAVGDVLGWVFDAQGRVIEHKVNECVTSFTQGVLLQRPVIGVAGGVRKHRAILAALRGGWLNGLITDQLTAEFLLANAD